MSSKLRIQVSRTNGERRRDALIAAGVSPSSFGYRRASRPHRDRKKEAQRGERKHKTAWF